MKTTQTVEALLRPVVTGMGYELDEVEFQKEQGNWVLTLYIEHQDGRSATIDDCEAVSRAVDPILDEADPIEQAYYLSVSSIGIDRPLKKDRDYQRSLGSPITVKLYAPLKGQKGVYGRAFVLYARFLHHKRKGRGDDLPEKGRFKGAALYRLQGSGKGP